MDSKKNSLNLQGKDNRLGLSFEYKKDPQGSEKKAQATKKGRKTQNIKKNPKKQPIPQPNTIKLFVGGLAGSTSEGKMFQYFSRFGEVTSISLIKPTNESDFSAGFGFVTMKSMLTMDAILSYTHQIDGNVVECQSMVDRQAAKRKEREEMDRKLFVGGLSEKTSDFCLKKFFEKIGAVQKAYVVKDHKTGRSRGFGFVLFEDPASIQDAMKNKKYYIDKKQVHLKVSRPKDHQLDTSPQHKQSPKEGQKISSDNNKKASKNRQDFKEKSSQNFYYERKEKDKEKEKLSKNNHHPDRYKFVDSFENDKPSIALGQAHFNHGRQNHSQVGKQGTDGGLGRPNNNKINVSTDRDNHLYEINQETSFPEKNEGYFNYQSQKVSPPFYDPNTQKNSFSEKNIFQLSQNNLHAPFLYDLKKSSEQAQGMLSPLPNLSGYRYLDRNIDGRPNSNFQKSHKPVTVEQNDNSLLKAQANEQGGSIGGNLVHLRLVLEKQEMSKKYLRFEKKRLGAGYKEYCRVEYPIEDYCKKVLGAQKKERENTTSEEQSLLSNGFLELQCRIINS